MKNEIDSEYCELGFIEQCKLVWSGIKRGFTYDGCTVVPDFNFGNDCCNEHDYHYQAQEISRREADSRMRECISRKGYKPLAWVYWTGVRVLGWIWWHRRSEWQKFGPAKDFLGT